MVEQRERRKEAWANQKAEDDQKRALAEAEKEVSEEARLQKEEDLETKYAIQLLEYKNKFGMLTDEELTAQLAILKKK